MRGEETVEDEPFIATFLLVLPDALPITHGSTWTRQLEEGEPLLDGVKVRPPVNLDHVVVSPEDGEGHNFVSLRFWQMHNDQVTTPEYVHRSLLAARVSKALNPESTADPEALVDAKLNDYEPYQTVVEATTFVARDREMIAGEDKPDPLTRCIDVLTGFHRSYRVITHEHVAALTYERLHPPKSSG